MGQQATDTQIKVTEKAISIPQAEADAHVLEPGEWAILLDENGRETEHWGIVCKSDRNNAQRVEIRIENDPVRTYGRHQLRWLGPMD